MQEASNGHIQIPSSWPICAPYRLEQAKQEGIVDIILNGADEQLRQCDMIFLCTPVEYNASYLKAIRPYLKSGAIVTDVGSTKTNIHEEVIRLQMEDCFRRPSDGWF